MKNSKITNTLFTLILMVMLVTCSVSAFVGNKQNHDINSIYPMLNIKDKNKHQTPLISLRIPRPFIYINGNNDFSNRWGNPKLLKGVIGGAGTKDDPYIIANWFIFPRLFPGYHPLIHIENTNAHFIIKDCYLFGLHFGNLIWNNGIYLHNVSNGSVINCEIMNCYNGVWIHNSTYNFIEHCYFKNNRGGIYIRRSSFNNVVNCESENCLLDGICISWGNDPNNENEHTPSSYNTIENCVFHGSYYKADYGVGIYMCCLGNSTGNRILNCTCYDNRYGIWLHNWISNTSVQGCVIANNTYGMHISIGTNNKIHHNSFFNNTRQAYDSNNNLWYDNICCEGNYWSDYTGEDINGDGIGDDPYPIPGGENIDWYPLMSPS